MDNEAYSDLDDIIYCGRTAGYKITFILSPYGDLHNSFKWSIFYKDRWVGSGVGDSRTCAKNMRHVLEADSPYKERWA